MPCLAPHTPGQGAELCSVNRLSPQAVAAQLQGVGKAGCLAVKMELSSAWDQLLSALQALPAVAPEGE